MKICVPKSSFQEIIDIILASVPVDKIFLLAVQTTNCRAESIFLPESVPSKPEQHYLLLVLITSNDNNSNGAWQDMIENCCRNIGRVTAWVLPIKSFNEALAFGQFFARHVLSEAIMCYDRGKLDLVPPSSIGQTDKLLKESERWLCRASEFLAGVELYILRQQYRTAAFLLHQAAEQTYIGLVYRSTGFRVITHNLEKLHRYAGFFTPQLNGIFSNQTEKEELYFRLLQKAYIDSRYNNEYTIREVELLILMEKVKQLLSIAITKEIATEP